MPFTKKLQKFNATIRTVELGTGDKAVKLGGGNTLPFYSFDAPTANTAKIGIEISDLGLAAMDKAVIEPGHVLRIAENQTVVVPVFHHLIKEQAHFFGIGVALLHVHFRPFEEFAEKSHTRFLLKIDDRFMTQPHLAGECGTSACFQHPESFPQTKHPTGERNGASSYNKDK